MRRSSTYHEAGYEEERAENGYEHVDCKSSAFLRYKTPGFGIYPDPIWPQLPPPCPWLPLMLDLMGPLALE